MALSSLKKMSRIQAGDEGNYASADEPTVVHLTQRDLGLTLYLGSQRQKATVNELEAVKQDLNSKDGIAEGQSEAVIDEGQEVATKGCRVTTGSPKPDSELHTILGGQSTRDGHLRVFPDAGRTLLKDIGSGRSIVSSSDMQEQTGGGDVLRRNIDNENNTQAKKRRRVEGWLNEIDSRQALSYRLDVLPQFPFTTGESDSNATIYADKADRYGTSHSEQRAPPAHATGPISCHGLKCQGRDMTRRGIAAIARKILKAYSPAESQPSQAKEPNDSSYYHTPVSASTVTTHSAGYLPGKGVRTSNYQNHQAQLARLGNHRQAWNLWPSNDYVCNAKSQTLPSIVSTTPTNSPSASTYWSGYFRIDPCHSAPASNNTIGRDSVIMSNTATYETCTSDDLMILEPLQNSESLKAYNEAWTGMARKEYSWYDGIHPLKSQIKNGKQFGSSSASQARTNAVGQAVVTSSTIPASTIKASQMLTPTGGNRPQITLAALHERERPRPRRSRRRCPPKAGGLQDGFTAVPQRNSGSFEATVGASINNSTVIDGLEEEDDFAFAAELEAELEAAADAQEMESVATAAAFGLNEDDYAFAAEIEAELETSIDAGGSPNANGVIVLDPQGAEHDKQADAGLRFEASAVSCEVYCVQSESSEESEEE
ncbi:hypothetical protein MMC21_003032 [Puttea exsequens]|nr:hypothetical protein [Puttea exsequens]